MRLSLIFAALLVVALSFFEQGRAVTYPFVLFSTVVHEMSHAVAVWLTGGYVHEIVVNFDTSGHVKHSGGWGVVVSTAGYTGTTLVGAAIMLAVMLKLSRAVVWACLATSVVLASWGAISWSTFTLFTGGAFTIASWFALKALDDWLEWIVSFIGVQLVFDSFKSLGDLWSITSTSNAHSDAVNMASYTGLPATFWVITWALFSGVIAFLCLSALFQRETEWR